jgi:PAS domain S-box-containing protein
MDASPAARYEAICEASPDAILLVDADGHITYANARVADLFGYEPSELVGEPVELLVPEADRDAHVAHREAYLDEPRTRPMGADLDLAARRKDGSTVPVAISLSPIPGDDEVEVMAAVRDVSEQQGLRKKYRSILQAVPDAVVIADAETGEIVEANERVADLTGHAPGDLVGEPQTVLHPSEETARYRDLFARYVVDDRDLCTRFSDGSDIHVETAAGERVPVEINASTFELDGRRLIVGVFRDVTTRKEQERRLSALHRATRDLMAADDRDAIVRLIADTADEILGFASTVVRLAVDGERLEPAAVTDRARTTMGSRPEYPIGGDHPASRAYRTGEIRHHDDVRDVEDDHDRGAARAAMYLPIGEHGVISITDTAVAAFDRADVELAAILAANAETALDRLASERRLERQNDRLEEFASIVSHDLRNPLHAARGWLDVARSERSTEELDRVDAALARMSEMIDDTLALARHGETVDEPEAIDLARLARDCWAMVSPAQGRLVVEDVGRVRGDPDRLCHVFENLFRNSVEHGSTDSRTPSGTAPDEASGDPSEGDELADAAPLTVTVGALDGDGFYVADDGPGLPEADRERIFERGHTTAPDGTGFGLAIVRQVVEAHGWEITATDGDDGGARFEITGVEFLE